ncbi:carboxymuconolactone decarboxylase family protein [Streptomyces sp. NPDC006798]|uniref:carboxymuconolactone decarboxylase family protein n=1 Tax=Streptomyces sp. NPDC006798 TaxID=3155462 RepID=UPI0033C9B708
MTTSSGSQDESATAPAAERAPDRLPEHTPRIDLGALDPGVHRAMNQLDRAVHKVVDPVLHELVKIRASQINHCAFCIDMHTKDALAAGETVERIVQLSAWRESRHFYSAKEVAALDLTEAITVPTDGFVPDDVVERAAKEFEPAELTGVIAAINLINVWNRLALTARMVPGHYEPGMFPFPVSGD